MVLRIGTDCSGIEAPIQALQQLNIPFKHKWSCEIDTFARQSIEANYKPEKMYIDITTRKHALLPDVDMYVCGFPCTPFSLMGSQKGTEDVRSKIMFHCIEVIQKKLPKFFILENVKNFKTIQNAEPFNYLINQLKKIKYHGKIVYNVYYQILNTKNYGIPQNRDRLFIIGICKDIQVAEYSIPDKIPMKCLDHFIIDKTIRDNTYISNSLQKNLDRITDVSGSYVVTPCGHFSVMKGIIPTLTTQCHQIFFKKYNRYIFSKEALLLQGFSSAFKQVVSNRQLYKQVGNSMSVCVLKAIIEKLLSVIKPELRLQLLNKKL